MEYGDYDGEEGFWVEAENGDEEGFVPAKNDDQVWFLDQDDVYAVSRKVPGMRIAQRPKGHISRKRGKGKGKRRGNFRPYKPGKKGGARANVAQQDDQYQHQDAYWGKGKGKSKKGKWNPPPFQQDSYKGKDKGKPPWDYNKGKGDGKPKGKGYAVEPSQPATSSEPTQTSGDQQWPFFPNASWWSDQAWYAWDQAYWANQDWQQQPVSWYSSHVATTCATADGMTLQPFAFTRLYELRPIARIEAKGEPYLCYP